MKLVKSLLPFGFMLIALLGAAVHFARGYSHADFSGHAWGSDDAYISYRYAQNLAAGHGLVFNPGDRVEGYSNFLYTVLIAPFTRIDPDFVYPASVTINIIFFLITLVIFLVYVRSNTEERTARVALLALCLSPLMWVWPASGMETSAVLLVQLALVITADLAVRNSSGRFMILYCCLAGLSILLRVDGFIFPLLASLVFLSARKYRDFFLAVAFTILMTGLTIAARYMYYGDFLPNTYYVKVSGTLLQRLEAAWDQMKDLFRNDAFYIFLIPLVLGWGKILSGLKTRGISSTQRTPEMNIPTGIIPIIALGLLAYWFYIGGDVFYERFLLVLIPLAVIHLVRNLPSKWVIPLLICFIALQSVPLAKDQRFEYRSPKYDRWVELGKHLALEHPQATLAIDAAGKVPFYSQLHTIDMLGLNDAHIARQPSTYFQVGHNKFDPDYIFAQEPDLIAAWGTPGLDLAWGITRQRYRAAGYRLKYLVNALAISQPKNIVDVSDLDEEIISTLFSSGYTYFVISHEP